MSSSSSAARWLVVGVAWLVILGIGAMAYRLLLAPQKKAELVSLTTSDPRHQQQVRIALDSFSGYAVFRSAGFRDELGTLGVGLELVDDQADYAARLKSVASGETPLAVFTIDALIKASADAGEMPATIVMIVDETIGADAVVAYKQALKNVDALDRPDVRIVATRDSPSEMLVRVLMSTYALPALPRDCWIAANGAGDAYAQFTKAKPNEPKAFVLWEPYVSKALENPDAHVLMDSSRFRGYIVDVLVAQRGFLLQNGAIVDKVMQAYQTALWRYRQQPKGMQDLVMADAQASGESLATAQAQRLVQTIWWKSTQENFAHFDLRLGGEKTPRREGLQRLDEMIRKTVKVLIDTKAIARDPTSGHPEELFYDKLLTSLAASGWHPTGLGGVDDDGTRSPNGSRVLDDAEWERLTPVGKLQVDPIVFARSRPDLLPSSEATLEQLVDTLRSWPYYYLIVRGHARQEGDAEANKQLADARARAVAAYLAQHGIEEHRVRALAAQTTATGGDAQSVTFELSQMPY